MSLLVDTEYLLHSLRLNYIRHLSDPAGPLLLASLHSDPLDNPYVVLGGLADPDRWPELQVAASPPSSSLLQSSDLPDRGRGGSTRSGLQHTTTIRGASKRDGSRPSGDNLNSATDRRGRRLDDGRGEAVRLANRRALALTEGTSQLAQRLNLDPEADSSPEPSLVLGEPEGDEGGSGVEESADDEIGSKKRENGPVENNKRHKRKSTEETVRGPTRPGVLAPHRRKRSEVSVKFQMTPLQGESPAPSSNLASPPRRRSSSFVSESNDAFADFSSGSMSPQASPLGPDARSAPSILSASAPSAASTPPVNGANGRQREWATSMAAADPDKRLSDMLFASKAIAAPLSPSSIPPHLLGRVPSSRRRKLPNRLLHMPAESESQVVGSIGPGPNPLAVEELAEEDEEEVVPDVGGTFDSQFTTSGGASVSVSGGPGSMSPSADSGMSSLGSFPIAADAALSRTSHSNGSGPAQTPTLPRLAPRRERRRVNIKVGAGGILFGDSTLSLASPKTPSETATSDGDRGRPKHHGHLSGHHSMARPSLPNLRSRSGSGSSIGSVQTFGSVGGRMRSRTAPDGVSVSSSVNERNGGPAALVHARTRGLSGSSRLGVPSRSGSMSTQTSAQGSTSSSKRRAPLTFERVIVPATRPPLKSNLSAALKAQSNSTNGDNPFRTTYAALASKERGRALTLKVWFPFSKESKKPLTALLRPDVNVEEVLGFALWLYVEEGREPKLMELDPKVEGTDEGSTEGWSLWLVEDDGEVDEDFPALERSTAVGKVGSTEFAVVKATQGQLKQNKISQAQIVRRRSRILGEPPKQDSMTTLADPALLTGTGLSVNGLLNNDVMGMSGIGSRLGPSVSQASIMTLGPPAAGGATVLLRIRIPSPGKGVDAITTTLSVTTETYLADVLEHVCKKKGLGKASAWALIVPASVESARPDVLVPLDRTVTSLQGVNLLALKRRQDVKGLIQSSRSGLTRNDNPSASIFKRLSEPPQPKYVTASDLTATYKSFHVQSKRRGILGKQDRMLSIEGDHVHVGPGAGLGHGGKEKTASYHASQIAECDRRGQQGFKLVVWRDHGQEKRYDIEAEDVASAAEIVAHIQALMELHRVTSRR